MDISEAAFINEKEISNILQKFSKPSSEQVNDVLVKAREMKGLNLKEVAILTGISDPLQLHELFETANYIKETI